METTPDKILETTNHRYLKKDYTVIKKTRNRKILYTGIVTLSDDKTIEHTCDKTIEHTCKRKRNAKKQCRMEIKKSIK